MESVSYTGRVTYGSEVLHQRTGENPDAIVASIINFINDHPYTSGELINNRTQQREGSFCMTAVE
ncbi:MAG: hypothetical protein DHS20C10_03160 [marine bacterium B5-7]|nr:MAG: hypothetical protein DHS20C10_03160 [marine bacterium B5-7]